MDQSAVEVTDHPLWVRLGMHEVPGHKAIVLAIDEMHKMAVDGTRVLSPSLFVRSTNFLLSRYQELTPRERMEGHRWIDGPAGGGRL